MEGAIITAAGTLLVAVLVRNYESRQLRIERRIGLYAQWVKSIGDLAGIASVRNIPAGDGLISNWNNQRDEAWNIHSHLYEQLLLIGKVETVLAAQRVLTALREADRIKLEVIANKSSDLSYLGELDFYNNHEHTALIFTLLGDFADKVRREISNKQIGAEDLRKARTLSEVILSGEKSRHTASVPSKPEGKQR